MISPFAYFVLLPSTNWLAFSELIPFLLWLALYRLLPPTSWLALAILLPSIIWLAMARAKKVVFSFFYIPSWIFHTISVSEWYLAHGITSLWQRTFGSFAFNVT